MLTIISYDVPSDRRRARLAHVLEDFGLRVQFSVFEGRLDDDDLERLRKRIEKEINAAEDRVRIYRICAECERKIELFGAGEVTVDPAVYVV